MEKKHQILPLVFIVFIVSLTCGIILVAKVALTKGSNNDQINPTNVENGTTITPTGIPNITNLAPTASLDFIKIELKYWMQDTEPYVGLEVILPEGARVEETESLENTGKMVVYGNEKLIFNIAHEGFPREFTSVTELESEVYGKFYRVTLPEGRTVYSQEVKNTGCLNNEAITINAPCGNPTFNVFDVECISEDNIFCDDVMRSLRNIEVY